MRRYTRLSNGFSRKLENHAVATALNYFAYNFIKVHRTLRMTPVMAAGAQKHPSEEYSEPEWDFAYLPDDEWRNEVPLPTIPILWDTAHFTRRVGAQRRRFMMFGTDPSWMQRIMDERDWVKMLTIEGASISRIKHELRDAGITESVIFPDLVV